jgi:hypothetical protein
MKKKCIWPVTVTAKTHDEAGAEHNINRTVEGAGNIEDAMLKAVLYQKQPRMYLGCEITGVTQLGQICKRIFEMDGSTFCLKKHAW